MGLIEVYATINLPGLPAGSWAKVDSSKSYISRCLAAEFLVPVNPLEVPVAKEADTARVPLYGAILPDAGEDEGTDGNSAEESDEQDGPSPLDAV